jgi:DnaJ family protein C protein 19
MWGFVIVLAVLTGLWALRRMGRMKPQDGRKFQRQLLGAGLSLVALFFILHGNFRLGLPALAIGTGLLGFSHLLPQGLGAGASTSQPARSPMSGMDKAEALKVLGLKPGASAEDVKAAHKRLQRTNHPDAGGTDYLAGKINQARDILLNS